MEDESTVPVDVENWFGIAAALPALPKVQFRPAIDDLDIRRLREAVAALGLDMAQQNVALDEIRSIYRRLDG